MLSKHRYRRLTGASLVVLLIVAAAGGVQAQDVAVGQATATVVASLTVTASRALDFGNVYQGVRSDAANNTDAAAIFEISGQADAGVDLYLQLPQYLSLSGGGARMPISFGATDASVDTTGAGDPPGMAAGKGWQNTNPYSLPASVIIGSSGTDLYLGGSVSPAVQQQAGSYSGDIILTVTYNGN